MRDRFQEALKTAIKAKESVRVATLRLILTAVKERDIAARTEEGISGIDDQAILGVLAKMIKQREESAKIYEENGRLGLAEQERAEIEVIREFLPKQMDEAEMAAAVRDTVDELDASGLKDMGRCMAALKERYAGQMDFSKASSLVKGALK